MTAFKDYIGAKDIKYWDGVARTFDRSTSTGGTLTQNKIGSIIDIINVYGDGTAYTDATLSLALGTVGSNKAVFLFQPGTWAIANDVTVPTNITLLIPHGAVLEIANGKTLTVNGPVIAGSYIVFDSTGTVAGAPIIPFKDPTWFSGTVTDSTSPAARLTTINVDTINETTAAGGVTIDGSLIKDGDIKVDTITEKTAAAGVTIDGSLIKDGEIKVDTVSEKNAGAGVTIDGSLIKDGDIKVDTITEKTAAAGVTVDGCLIKDGVVSGSITTAVGIDDQGGGSDLKVKVIEIGDWNMDATTTVNIAHGLTLANIRFVSVLIRRDSGTDESYDFNSLNFSETSSHSIYITTSNVSLNRGTGGVFDAAIFSSTSYNRGWITIWYV